MGIFDKLFKADVPAEFKYQPANEQEAWVAILYSCMSVDGEISDSEIESMSRMCVFKKIFKDHDFVAYYKNAMLAKGKIGNQNLIDKSTPIVSEDNKATLFSMAVELLLADGILGDDEKEIMDYLYKSLKLNEELAHKIVEVMLIRTKGGYILN